MPPAGSSASIRLGRALRGLAVAVHDVGTTIRVGLFPPRALARTLTLLSIAVSLGMVGLGCAILLDLRRQAWDAAEQQSDNLIHTLSRDIARNIGLYDLSIQGAIDAYSNPAVQRLDPDMRQLAIFDRAATADYLGSMIIANAHGDVMLTSTSTTVPALSLATREHFLVHQREPDVGLFISRPFQGRIVHDQLIALTRRISNPDGSFGGVAEGAMRIAYFHDLFAALALGRGGSVTLFRDDGRIIMRRPFQSADIDRDLSEAPSFRHLHAARQGRMVALAGVDGVERLYTFGPIDGLPLILSIGMATEDIYVGWWRKATTIGMILLVLCSASVGLCLLFRRELTRRMAAEQSLIDAAKRLSAAAMTDSLTGIPNRRAFDEALSRGWRRSIREQTPIAVLLLDVDSFKLFNDRYGHQAGDEVLRALAACLARNARRPLDTAARYGGEEFVALLPSTELAGALFVAEAVRESIAGLAVPHEGSPIGHVTASIGVAVTYPAIGDSADALLRDADAALYQAKREGRDRIVASPASLLAARPASNAAALLADS